VAGTRAPFRSMGNDRQGTGDRRSSRGSVWRAGVSGHSRTIRLGTAIARTNFVGVQVRASPYCVALFALDGENWTAARGARSIIRYISIAWFCAGARQGVILMRDHIQRVSRRRVLVGTVAGLTAFRAEPLFAQQLDPTPACRSGDAPTLRQT